MRLHALATLDRVLKDIISERAAAKNFTHENLYCLVEFGSTFLSVESINSDLDLIVFTYDCLFDRKSFYIALEKTMSHLPEVQDLIVVWGANVPIAKFSVNDVSVDLVFTDFVTPKLQ